MKEFDVNRKPPQSQAQDNTRNGIVQVDHGFADSPRALLTAEEVAEILRVPRSWVYSHQDQLPTVRLGRYVRFRRSEIESFLAEQKAC